MGTVFRVWAVGFGVGAYSGLSAKVSASLKTGSWLGV